MEFGAKAAHMKVKFDLERVIDDFVFFCFFVGNDFLPNINTLDIGEGSLEDLIRFYKQLMPQFEDYITDSGIIHWDRAQPFISMLSQHEETVFMERMAKEKDTDKIMQEIAQTDPSLVQAFNSFRKAGRPEKYSQKIYEKKVEKLNKVKAQKRDKKYKKIMMTKNFAEDAERRNKLMSKDEQKILVKKLTYLRKKQNEDSEAKIDLATLPGDIAGLLGELDEKYLSDLKPEDIPDSEVSDVTESDITTDYQEETKDEVSKLLVESKLQN